MSDSISASLRKLQNWRKRCLRWVIAAAFSPLPFFQSSWPLKGGHKANLLVNQGPYFISRNSLYMFSFVGALGAGLQSGSLSVGALFLAVTIVVFIPVVKGEEAALAALFGSAFEAYKARVPRFWHSLKAWQEAKSLPVSTRLLYIAIRDDVVFVLVIPLFETIDWLQNTGWIAHVLRLP